MIKRKCRHTYFYLKRRAICFFISVWPLLSFSQQLVRVGVNDTYYLGDFRIYFSPRCLTEKDAWRLQHFDPAKKELFFDFQRNTGLLRQNINYYQMRFVLETTIPDSLVGLESEMLAEFYMQRQLQALRNEINVGKRQRLMNVTTNSEWINGMHFYVLHYVVRERNPFILDYSKPPGFTNIYWDYYFPYKGVFGTVLLTASFSEMIFTNKYSEDYQPYALGCFNAVLEGITLVH